jgi:hypothetical protein
MNFDIQEIDHLKTLHDDALHLLRFDTPAEWCRGLLKMVEAAS